MVPATITRVVILVLGHLYPAYASYKAIQSRNTREYVKWMMYWIVLALFTCAETLADIFLSFWFPLYEEIKILLIIWFISPATRGSSFLYRRFVHPFLQEKSGEIDEYVQNAQRQGTRAMLDLGRKGVACASNLLLEFSAKAYSFTSQSLVQGTRPGEGDGNGEGGKEQGGRPVRSRNTLPSLPNRQFSASQMDLGTRTAAGSSQDFQDSPGLTRSRSTELRRPTGTGYSSSSSPPDSPILMKEFMVHEEEEDVEEEDPNGNLIYDYHDRQQGRQQGHLYDMSSDSGDEMTRRGGGEMGALYPPMDFRRLPTSGPKLRHRNRLPPKRIQSSDDEVDEDVNTVSERNPKGQTRTSPDAKSLKVPKTGTAKRGTSKRGTGKTTNRGTTRAPLTRTQNRNRQNLEIPKHLQGF